MDKLPDIFYFDFDDPKLDKKWNNSKEDLSDYFNYGFNEEIWKQYVSKVKLLNDNLKKNNEKIDNFPLELGGSDNTNIENIQNYELINQFFNNKEKFFLQNACNDNLNFYSQLSFYIPIMFFKDSIKGIEKDLTKYYNNIDPNILKKDIQKNIINNITPESINNISKKITKNKENN